MSGYTDEAIGHQGALEAGTHFLQKRSRTSTAASRIRRPRWRAWIRRPRVEGAKYTHLISSVAEQLFRFDAQAERSAYSQTRRKDEQRSANNPSAAPFGALGPAHLTGVLSSPPSIDLPPDLRKGTPLVRVPRPRRARLGRPEPLGNQANLVNGIHEVTGSIAVSSTKSSNDLQDRS